jgi:galactose mutarotase-like enzyme
MKELRNNIISISVDSKGAELQSLRKAGREYLWQGDAEYWNRRSPILFPIVGSLWNNRFRTHGEVFSMGQHGFARDMNFHLAAESDTELEYELNSSHATQYKFPFSFQLTVLYRIRENVVDVEWKVLNTGIDDISFQIGAHPAFHYPLLSNSIINSGIQAMKSRLNDDNRRGYFLFDAKTDRLKSAVITKKGCIDPKKEKIIELDEGYMAIDTDTFNDDALIFEDGQVQAVTLCNQEKEPYITLKFDAPCVGLWSPAGKNAPFVCIEPWYGRADDVEYMGYFEDRKWMQTLKTGQVFKSKYHIIIE